MDRWQARAVAMQIVAESIGYRIIGKSSADGQSDLVEYHAGDADQDVGSQPVRRMEPFGLHSVPPEGLPALVLYVNGSPNAGVVVASGNEKYFPAGLATGEVVIYNKTSGCTVKLDANGKITIDAAAAQDVVVNGGTLKVAAHGDATAGHTHAHGGMTGTITGTANLMTGAVTGTCVLTAGNTGSATDNINVTAARRFKT